MLEKYVVRKSKKMDENTKKVMFSSKKAERGNGYLRWNMEKH